MEIRHLRYFVAVAEELHFGRAADRVHISQPPLSARIAALERELGARLFDRTNRRVALTAAGRTLLPHAREAIATFERARTAVSRAGLAAVGEIRLGLPPETAAPVVAALRAGLRRSHPALALTVVEACTADQVDRLRRAELDVGLLRHPVALDGLVTGPRLLRPVGVALHRDHHLARNPELGLADLAGQTLLMFPREGSPGLYDALLDGCRAAGYDPPRVVHATRLLPGLLAPDDGVALQPTPVPAAHPELRWRPLSDELVWHTSLVRPDGPETPLWHRLDRLVRTALHRHERWRPVPADGDGSPPPGRDNAGG